MVFQQKLKEVCKTFNCGTSEKMWVTITILRMDNFETKTLSAMMANVAWNTEMSEKVYGWTGKYPAINCFDYVATSYMVVFIGIYLSIELYSCFD